MQQQKIAVASFISHVFLMLNNVHLSQMVFYIDEKVRSSECILKSRLSKVRVLRKHLFYVFSNHQQMCSYWKFFSCKFKISTLYS